MLTLADNLKLPVDAVTQTFAILAKRGVGKTHTAMVMAEEMLQIGQPIVVYDPTSAWWGLKSSQDGKRPGYPVVIFGGDHADVPLEETAGATIATVIVEKRIPAVLDVGLLRKGARVRFMTDFCETLYHKNREALHFFCDEAHTIAPQNIRSMPEAARLLGAMEDIVLQGRRRGLGVTVISQRPALVNKNCTTQCEVLIAMQLTGAHDRKAIEEWVDVHGDDQSSAKQMLASLSSLQRGEAWVWSPGWLRKLVRTKFRERQTFDSSATPKVGGRIITPKSVAAIDLAALGDQIKATVERAKADDPKELRRQIADLSRKLDKPAQTLPKVDPAAIERARQAGRKDADKQIAHLLGFLNAARKVLRNIEAEASGQSRALEAISPVVTSPASQNSRVTHGEASASTHHRERRKAGVLTDASTQLAKSPAAISGSRAVDRTSAPATGETLSKAERAILTAFYWLQHEEATPAKVAFYSNYSAGTSTMNNALGRLRHGLISGWKITNAGCALIENYRIAPKPSGSELIQWIKGKLSKAEIAFLDALLAVYPKRMTNEELAARSGYSAGTSTFNNAIGRLRTLEVAEGYAKDGGIKASDVFFE